MWRCDQVDSWMMFLIIIPSAVLYKMCEMKVGGVRPTYIIVNCALINVHVNTFTLWILHPKCD